VNRKEGGNEFQAVHQILNFGDAEMHVLWIPLWTMGGKVQEGGGVALHTRGRALKKSRRADPPIHL